MSSVLILSLVWSLALSSALMSGIYFAFSSFIMTAFSKINPDQSIAAMNSINEVIVRSLFMPLFLGSSFISLSLLVLAYINRSEPGSYFLFAAGFVYFIGMFLCTVVFNVPLNNVLARVATNSVDSLATWSRYLDVWTKWNHLRTISSLITFGLCLYILIDK